MTSDRQRTADEWNELVKERDQLARWQQDTVPRSRYNACNQDWLDAEAKLKKVQANVRPILLQAEKVVRLWEQQIKPSEGISFRLAMKELKALMNGKRGV